MGTRIAVQLESQGLLIPRAALHDWDMQELEAVWQEQVVVLRPKLITTDSRHRVRQVLREAGMLYEPDWKTPPPVTLEQRAHLAEKLSQGQPLSEIIITDRDEPA